MGHAKKMVLIPEETVQNFQTTSDTPLSMNRVDKSYDTVLTRLDQEMNEILCSTAYQNEREKWHAYSRVIKWYLRLISNETQPTPIQNLIQSSNEKVPHDKTDVSSNSSFILNNHNIDQSVLGSVPKKFQSKAKLLYKRLKNTSDDIISWDNTGVISIDGRVIRGSNIIDLLNDAMRSRKNEYAIGRAQFAMCRLC